MNAADEVEQQLQAEFDSRQQDFANWIHQSSPAYPAHVHALYASGMKAALRLGRHQGTTAERLRAQAGAIEFVG